MEKNGYEKVAQVLGEMHLEIIRLSTKNESLEQEIKILRAQILEDVKVVVRDVEGANA